MTQKLNYEGYEQYMIKEEHYYDGIRYIFKFENGWGAAVFKHSRSYGGQEGLWSLGVIRYFKCGNEPWCSSPERLVTEHETEGYLSDYAVRVILDKITKLY